MLNVLLHLGRACGTKKSCMELHFLNIFKLEGLQKDMIFVGTALATEAMFRQLILALNKFFHRLCFSSAMRFG